MANSFIYYSAALNRTLQSVCERRGGIKQKFWLYMHPFFFVSLSPTKVVNKFFYLQNEIKIDFYLRFKSNAIILLAYHK